jgi:hypothetical protein
VCNWAYNADRHRSTWSNKDDHVVVVVVVQGSLVISKKKEEAFLIKVVALDNQVTHKKQI